MTEIELDPELLTEFIIESRELLDEFASNIIELESQPDDPDTVGAIFRAAHTLKGSSAFFNLIHIKNFAHKLENLLDEIRNLQRAVNDQVISILISGANHLKSMFERLGSGDYSTELSPEQDRFLAELLEFLEQGSEGAAQVPEDILSAIKAVTTRFFQEDGDAEQAILDIEALLVGVESGGADQEALDQGEINYSLGGVDLTEIVGRANEIMDAADQSGEFNVAGFDQILVDLEGLVRDNGLDALQAPLSDAVEDFRAVADSGIDFDVVLIGLMKDKLAGITGAMEKTVVETEVQPGPPVEAAPAEAAPQAKAPERARGQKDEKVDRKTMRIDEDKVDGFMNYVGELIVTAESFNYLQKMIENEKVNPITVRAFKNANQAFRELSGELQESLMEIRRVPIKGVLQKVNMMARELSQQMDKKVKVEIAGQEVQLDKSIAESLEGPLVHVVRNSLDHGLEMTADREGTGKSAEGLLQVLARADKEYFFLDVVDDGKGIDPVKIRQAAVDKGVMSDSQAQALTDKEAINLIFSAGFSTAEEITDVSGRGVGMDVVRTNINNLNGSIIVESAVGEGTSISLKIPLSVTLQVIKALQVRVGKHHFIISLDDIVESLRPAHGDLSTVEGRGEVIMRRGKIMPLIRLYELFNVEPEKIEPSDAILVVVETAKGRFGLMVDDVLGQQQVVVKELDFQFRNLTFIAGSATLGDGRLGLVLDTEGVVQLAHGHY